MWRHKSIPVLVISMLIGSTLLLSFLGVYALKKKLATKKPATVSAQVVKARAAASGTYRCFSYNVSGGGSGNCRLFAPLILKKDGTYSLSSEKGTYIISKNTISLSASKIRGIGKLINNTQIRFEYDYNKWHHVLTYLKEGGSASSETKKEETTESNAPEIVVDLEIVYPAKDRSLGYVNFITLVQKGEDPVTATYKPTATALWDGDKTINVSFFKSMNQVRTQAIYTVYTDTGYGLSPIGTLDLTSITSGPVKKTILITQP